MRRRGLDRLTPSGDTVKKGVSAVAGATIGAIGSLTALAGNDPQRSTVPAYTYGKDNKAFGKAYNITSAPGSAGVKAVKTVLKHKGMRRR